MLKKIYQELVVKGGGMRKGVYKIEYDVEGNA